MKLGEAHNECHRCGRKALDLSAHYGECYKLCRGCWRVHREIVKIYRGADVGEFRPWKEGAV